MAVSDEPRSKALARASGSRADEAEPATSQSWARVQALREAIAQSDPKDVETRQALYLALADAIDRGLRGSTRAQQRDQLEIEQANALFHGKAFERAGVCFEKLGELELAARCFRQAGSIEALEAVHARQESDARNAESRAQFERKLDEAFAAGRRNLVLDQCDALLSDPEARRKHPEMMTRLNARVRDIRSRAPSANRCQLRVQGLTPAGPAITLTYIWGAKISAGRSPSADIAMRDPSLSREHLSFELDETHAHVQDLGSRTGSFLEGDALPPHEPTSIWPGETSRLGLGMQSNLEVRVLEQGPALLVLDPSQPQHLTCLGQPALPMILGFSDQGAPPSSIPDMSWSRDTQHQALRLTHADAAAKVQLKLGSHVICDPAPLELLIQDRLEITYQGRSFALEVLA